jgi:hypothetical protein
MQTKSRIDADLKVRISKHYSLRALAFLLVGIVATALLPLEVKALTPISQSYYTSDNLSVGSIVSIQSNTSDHVVPAGIDNTSSLLGVVINSNTSLLTIANATGNQVQVATSGTIPVLVSSINGPIANGDHITASPIAGVGMKATDNVRIIGVAQSALDNSNSKQETYTDKSGKKQTVTLGNVPVLINVAYYFKEADKTIIPFALQNVADAFAGKAVSTLPILIAAAIFVVMLIVVVSIVYSMIRSSIISVGRNPMSQSAIYRDLIQLSALVIVILGVGLISIYMVLTRL